MDIAEKKPPPSNVKELPQKSVIGSGGFKIPQTVLDEKKRMFSPNKK